MIAVPQVMLDIVGASIWHVATVFFRVGAMVAVLPAFGEQVVPMRVKLTVALAFTAIVAPAIPLVDAPPGVMRLAGLVFAETAVGLALGIGLRLFVIALQTAGAIAAHSTSLSHLLGGAGVEPVPAMAHLLSLAGLALAMMIGLHVRAAELLILSYDLFAPGAAPDARLFTAWGVSRIADAFSLAFVLAVPFVLASLIYNLALGVINRAMPQLMVAFVGAPAITLGGIALLALAAPVILMVWLQALDAFTLPSGGWMQ